VVDSLYALPPQAELDGVLYVHGSPLSDVESFAPQPEPDEERSRAASVDDAGGVTIDAPMLGVFYRSPSPGAPPFVDVGERVEADTIVCIIEVMKMMNSVPAGVAGTITEVHVENADAVEYGQALFGVEPA